MKKITVKDFNLNLEGMSEEAQAFALKQFEVIADVMNKALEGKASVEEIESKFDDCNKSISGFAALQKDNDELREQVKTLSDSLSRLQEKGLSANTIDAFLTKAEEMFNSADFKALANGTTKETGTYQGFNLKTVSLANDYSGGVLGLSRDSNVIVNLGEIPELHMRQVVKTNAGDVDSPYLYYTTIYDVNRNARYVSENGNLPATSFKMKEEYVGTKRVGTYLDISKRMLKSKAYLYSWLVNNLLVQVSDAEDAGILFGDGEGENLKGILAYSDVVDIAGELASGTAQAAGFLDTTTPIATYGASGAQTIITLKNPSPKFKNGMKITFAGAKDSSSVAVAAFNATFDVKWLNDTQFVIDLAYATSSTVANPTEVSAVLRSGMYHSVPTPNSGDVIKSAFAYMQYAFFRPNAAVMNSITLNAIECEKLTNGANLGVVENRNGVKYIAGYPVICKDTVPVGKVLIGDFKRGCELVDFNQLYIRWYEDTSTAISNQIRCVAEEEVIFAVYCAAAFAYFDIAALATAITKQ